MAIRIEDLWFFFAIALFGTAGMTMMTHAFRFAPAAVRFRILPPIGAGIIMRSGLFIIFRERRLDE